MLTGPTPPGCRCAGWWLTETIDGTVDHSQTPASWRRCRAWRGRCPYVRSTYSTLLSAQRHQLSVVSAQERVGARLSGSKRDTNPADSSLTLRKGWEGSSPRDYYDMTLRFWQVSLPGYSGTQPALLITLVLLGWFHDWTIGRGSQLGSGATGNPQGPGSIHTGLDQRLPCLRGASPRQAATRFETRALLIRVTARCNSL